MSDLNKRIVSQLEFYFSDSNLPRDAFLRGKVAENEDGWVPVDVLLTFKRLAELAKDAAAVAEAVRAENCQLLEATNEAPYQIRRATPLPESPEALALSRSVYARQAFPADSVTWEQVSEYWRQHGNVLSTRLRRNRDRSFKGSVFVEFSSPEEARAVVKKFALDKYVPKSAPDATSTAPTVQPAADQKASDTSQVTDTPTPATTASPAPSADPYYPTVVMMRQDYMTAKRGVHRARPDSSTAVSRKRRTTDDGDDATGQEGDAADGDDAQPQTPTWQKGCLVRLNGLSEGTDRADIRRMLEPFGLIAYIDYREGPTAVVRMRQPADAQAVLTALAANAVSPTDPPAASDDGAPPAIESKVTAVLVTGDEENGIWETIVSGAGRSGRGRGRRGGRGGRRGGGRGGGRARRRKN